MKIVNVGSINIDHVYEVPHFVRPGETLSALNFNTFAGGKGFNQSIALARAGAEVIHVVNIDKKSGWLLDKLKSEGVDTSHIKMDDAPTGHAIIQVTPSGENSIVIHGGANQTITQDTIEQSLAPCTQDDWLLLQNETNCIAEAMQAASKIGMRIAFNPAPLSSNIKNLPLELVNLFILNETEAEGLTGKLELEEIRSTLLQKFPNAGTVLTLGAKGAVYFDSEKMVQQPALTVNAIDTTAAGDTFIGYFLAEYRQNKDIEEVLVLACKAAANCVTKKGAADSIPFRSEL